MRLWPWLAALRIDDGIEPLIETTDVIPVIRRSKDRPPQDLRKAYGRASRTIHELRGENALLREDIRDARADAAHFDREAIAANRRAAQAQNLVDDLGHALDKQQPAPDPAVLGEQLKDAWFRPRAATYPHDERWRAVAETAIDAVRGIWPTRADLEQTAPIDQLTEREIAALDAEADRRLAATDSAWPYLEVPDETDRQIAEGIDRRIHQDLRAVMERIETSPGGGEGAEVAPASTGAPAPGGPDLEATADRHLEGLSQVLARRDLELTGTEWPRVRETLREYYRAMAADVINAGWRPPASPVIDVDRRAVLARALTDHELLADDTCRCGWGDWPPGHPEPAALWHAEHVAEQVLATGATA